MSLAGVREEALVCEGISLHSFVGRRPICIMRCIPGFAVDVLVVLDEWAWIFEEFLGFFLFFLLVRILRHFRLLLRSLVGLFRQRGFRFVALDVLGLEVFEFCHPVFQLLYQLFRPLKPLFLQTFSLLHLFLLRQRFWITLFIGLGHEHILNFRGNCFFLIV